MTTQKNEILKPSSTVDVGGHLGSLRVCIGESPAHELRIDREGNWFHEGVEIVREDIRKLFSRHLVSNGNGGYLVRIGEDECPVRVEDAPFVVIRVEQESADGLALLLGDGGREALDPRTIEFRGSNVPYCRVRDGLEARFSRAAYYQLAEFIEHDAESDRYYLSINGETVELEVN